jgi:ubiquinone/menaquinone biosynthesis C-methylase UbiE
MSREKLMTTINSAAVASDPLTERVRATWTTGDFGRIAKTYERGAGEFVARLDIGAGERVLDVATGTGNLAIPAARRGAFVTGVDIAPNLIEQARVNAEQEGLEITFDVGDAEELTYSDGAFDTVVTMFGAMFAARPERAAAELIRVTRAGGRIAMANWTPTGFIGQMFRTVARHVPPPGGIPSPILWGSEIEVNTRLRGGVQSLTLTPRVITFEYPFSATETVDLFLRWYGPTVRAFASLDDSGQRALRADLEALWNENNRATDGTTRVESEYLEVLAIVAQARP